MNTFDYISKVTENIYFGKYPCNEVITILKQLNITIILNLTQDTENLPDYATEINCTIINFPIVDRKCGKYNDTIELIKRLSNLLHNKIYIHCKGGHGRSGLICGGLYSYLYNTNYDETINILKKAHDNRKIMSDKMRFLGAPQTRIQKNQLKKLIEYFNSI